MPKLAFQTNYCSSAEYKHFAISGCEFVSLRANSSFVRMFVVSTKCCFETFVLVTLSPAQRAIAAPQTLGSVLAALRRVGFWGGFRIGSG